MTVFSKVALGTGVVVATAAVLSACGGGGSESAGQGTLRIALTDAPACGFEEVNVTIEAVRFHKSGFAAEGEGGWEEIRLETPKRVNLLELTNGVLEELGSTALPAGTYTQLRLVLAQNGSGTPLANSVLPIGGTEVALDTPSGQQSGLKLPVRIEVAADQVADFVIDFDACKSVVTRGQSNRFNLKPVLSLLPRVTTPGLAVQGWVDPALAGSASVSLQQDGIVVRSTVAMRDDPATVNVDESGKFILSPLPAGNYDLVISAEGRVTAVMTGVPVTEAGVTTVTPADQAIVLDPSAMQTAHGAVSTTGSTTVPDALVRALQTIDGTKVELMSRPVDAENGSYSFRLPVGAPVRTTYSANATTLNFTADAAAAGQYTLQASVPGQEARSEPVALADGDVETRFSFAP